MTNHEDDDDENNDDNTSYTLSTGNDGLVLTNEITDYLNRGEFLKHMCLWKYRSKVYKKKFSEEELKKHLEKSGKKKTGRECEEVYRFATNHPQSETHWQRVRIKGSAMVPTLSKIPPSSKSNELLYQKCILLLFKPFTSFEELYNGISWDETYSDFLKVTENEQYIENMQELLMIMEDDENDDNSDDVIEENEDGECDDDPCQSNDVDDTGLDSLATDALDIIRNTTWLDESVSNHQTMPTVQLSFDNDSLFPQWETDMEKQNEDKVNNLESDQNENDEEPSQSEFVTVNGNDDADVDFSMASVEQEYDCLIRLRDEIMKEKTLNKKQQKAYEMATDNVINRYFEEETEQLIGYVGGPGGTGKSQVIKAIVEFHERMKMKHALQLSAYTGTAAKHIGGSTTTTLFGFSSEKDKQKLQRKFRKVCTIIIDEVSMIGCRELVKIHKALCKAKCVPSSVPFGGVDIIFFGDFIQFPPVKDTPLYNAWSEIINESKSRQAQNTKLLGMHLWKQVNKVILLDEQMRCTDPVYLDLLNRLREGKCTNSDVALLNTRVVGQNVDITSILDVPIITPGNQLVMAINDLFIACYSHHTKVYISKAEDYIGKRRNGKKVPKSVARKIKNWASTSTKGLPRELQMFIGMPVMVTKNIATELGITNGTVGKVRSIHFQNGEVISEGTGYHPIEYPPDFIIVELDDINMKPLDGLPPNCVPISVKTEGFSVYLPGKDKSIHVNRRHFPLVPKFSCTAHKSQGATLRKAIIDLVPTRGKTKGVGIEFAYVPLSRVKRLQDLTILRPFDPSILNAKVNDACAAMMEEFKRRDLCRDL